MINVIIQTLIRNKRKNAKLPIPTLNEASSRKDKSGTFVLIIGLLILLSLILM